MILVTGATSRVGRAIITELLAQQVPVRALVHKPEDIKKFTAIGAEAMVADISQPASIRPALRDIDRVYLITTNSPQQPEQERLFAEEARKAGVQHLIKQSELGANTQSDGILLRLQGEAEQAIRGSGIPYTFLRPCAFMQNIPMFYAHSIIANSTMHDIFANTPICYVDARDIGMLAAHILTEKGHTHLGKAYEVTGPEAISSTQLAEKFSALLGRQIQYTSISDEDAKQNFLQFFPAWTVDAVVSLLRFYRLGGATSVTQEIERITGRKPRTIDAFLAENIQMFQGS